MKKSVIALVILCFWTSSHAQVENRKCFVWNLAPQDAELAGVVNNFAFNIQVKNPGWECVRLGTTKQRVISGLEEITSDDILVIVGHGDPEDDLIGPANLDDPKYNYNPQTLKDFFDKYVNDWDLDDDKSMHVYIKCCYTDNFAKQCNALDGPSSGKVYFVGNQGLCNLESNWKIPN